MTAGVRMLVRVLVASVRNAGDRWRVPPRTSFTYLAYLPSPEILQDIENTVFYL